MTRGEVCEELLNYENEYGFNSSDVYAIVSKIYDELEALQAPKTCDGCEYDEYNYLHKCETCSRHIRDDHYKPKEQQ